MKAKELYIRMCKRSPTIQKRWNPKAGDKYGIKIIDGEIFYKGTSDCESRYGSSRDDGDIWLPRQEDWQNMCENEGLSIAFAKNKFVLTDAWISINKRIEEDKIELETISDGYDLMWCAFYHYLEHNLVWDFTLHEWIKWVDE